MARIRSIKPEFWSSEQVVECSPTARLLFIGLWNFCDDGGNHPASTKTLKMEVFPGDCFPDSAIKTMVEELLEHGLLVEYVVDNKSYWHVTGWHHQKIEKPNKKYPTFQNPQKFDDQSANSRRQVGEQTPEEGKGGDIRKGKEETHPLPFPAGRERAGKVAAHDSRFDAFWDAYPRKAGKRDAAKAWAKLKPDEALCGTIMAALERHKHCDMWTKDGGQFVPYPATYLRGERWTDSHTRTAQRSALDDWMVGAV